MSDERVPYDSRIWGRIKKVWDAERRILEERRLQKQDEALTPEQRAIKENFLAGLEEVEKSQTKAEAELGIVTNAGTDDLTIVMEEKTILDVLFQEHPMAVTQEDLAQATRLSDRTVRKCIKRLREELGLTHRPLGPKKGESLTLKGLDFMRR